MPNLGIKEKSNIDYVKKNTVDAAVNTTYGLAWSREGKRLRSLHRPNPSSHNGGPKGIHITSLGLIKQKGGSVSDELVTMDNLGETSIENDSRSKENIKGECLANPLRQSAGHASTEESSTTQPLVPTVTVTTTSIDDQPVSNKPRRLQRQNANLNFLDVGTPHIVSSNYFGKAKRVANVEVYPKKPHYPIQRQAVIIDSSDCDVDPIVTSSMHDNVKQLRHDVLTTHNAAGGDHGVMIPTFRDTDENHGRDGTFVVKTPECNETVGSMSAASTDDEPPRASASTHYFFDQGLSSNSITTAGGDALLGAAVGSDSNRNNNHVDPIDSGMSRTSVGSEANDDSPLSTPGAGSAYANAGNGDVSDDATDPDLTTDAGRPNNLQQGTGASTASSLLLSRQNSAVGDAGHTDSALDVLTFSGEDNPTSGASEEPQFSSRQDNTIEQGLSTSPDLCRTQPETAASPVHRQEARMTSPTHLPAPASPQDLQDLSSRIVSDVITAVTSSSDLRQALASSTTTSDTKLAVHNVDIGHQTSKEAAGPREYDTLDTSISGISDDKLPAADDQYNYESDFEDEEDTTSKSASKIDHVNVDKCGASTSPTGAHLTEDPVDQSLNTMKNRPGQPAMTNPESSHPRVRAKDMKALGKTDPREKKATQRVPTKNTTRANSTNGPQSGRQPTPVRISFRQQTKQSPQGKENATRAKQVGSLGNVKRDRPTTKPKVTKLPPLSNPTSASSSGSADREKGANGIRSGATYLAHQTIRALGTSARKLYNLEKGPSSATVISGRDNNYSKDMNASKRSPKVRVTAGPPSRRGTSVARVSRLEVGRHTRKDDMKSPISPRYCGLPSSIPAVLKSEAYWQDGRLHIRINGPARLIPVAASAIENMTPADDGSIVPLDVKITLVSDIKKGSVGVASPRAYNGPLAAPSLGLNRKPHPPDTPNRNIVDTRHAHASFNTKTAMVKGMPRSRIRSLDASAKRNNRQPNTGSASSTASANAAK